MSLHGSIRKFVTSSLIAGMLLYSSPKSSESADLNFSKKDVAVLAANSAIGCLVAATKKENRWKRCKDGAIGGAIVFTGKEIAAKTDFPLLGGFVADYGNSKIHNAMKDDNQRDKYNFSYLAARVTYTPNEGFKVRVAPEDIVVPIYYLAKDGYELKISESLKRGSAFFYDYNINEANFERSAFGFTIGNTIVIRPGTIRALSRPYNFDFNQKLKSTERHESVHVLQSKQASLIVEGFNFENKIQGLEAKLGDFFDLSDLAGEMMFSPIYLIPRKNNPIEIEARALVSSPPMYKSSIK